MADILSGPIQWQHVEQCPECEHWIKYTAQDLVCVHHVAFYVECPKCARREWLKAHSIPESTKLQAKHA